jgi:hypothetical protein
MKSKQLGCDYEAPTFGAHYPDGTCIDGEMWDLDFCDNDGNLTGGAERPCPHCNTLAYLEYFNVRGSGNAQQRRIFLRKEARRVKLWAKKRSTFKLD